MNQQIARLLKERTQKIEKINMLTTRVNEINEAITKLENNEIIYAVRALNFNTEQLAEFLEHLKGEKNNEKQNE